MLQRVVSSWVSWSYPSRHHSLYQDDEAAKAHTLAHTHPGPGQLHTEYTDYFMLLPANMQFLSHQDTEHSECVYCPHSLAHSFSHFSLISSALADSQIFTTDYRKNGNKSGLTFGVSFSRSGDSWDTQLSTEARDETALIIIVTTWGYSENEFMNKPHHH